ncbi:hypothetical protein ABLE94_02970 [Gordonia sp. VNK1]|uniref:hypothetical protein n=1 Tax=Gordonia oleivorans TaxID=3156618 RepID=UPI0032B54292
MDSDLIAAAQRRLSRADAQLGASTRILMRHLGDDALSALLADYADAIECRHLITELVDNLEGAHQ